VNETERSRNDWLVVLLFLLLGVLFMLFAGQKGTQLLPTWILRVNLGSNLDPSNYAVDFGPDGLPALRPEILTPPAWGDKYLTPHPDDPAKATPPTFVVFDPSATPSVSATPSATPSATASPSATTTTTTTPPSPTATWTRPPRDDDPTPTATSTATASPTGYPDTLDPTAVAEISPTPAGVNYGPPDGSSADAGFPENTYFMVAVPTIVVGPTPDGNYELVYYESASSPTTILMDWVIVGVTNSTLWSSYTYYEVFNWGNGSADTNSNLNAADLGLPTAEVDNQAVSSSDLYEDPSSPAPPPNLQTGILIDVEGAASEPPPGDYDMVVVISPPGGVDSSAHVDAVDVTNEPLPP
jgi:hypothetical protein